MKKKVLILGGFGYLGTFLCNTLDKKYDIEIFGKKVPLELKEWSKEYKVHLGDILDENAISKAFRNIDYVIHLISPDDATCEKKPSLAIDINCKGTLNVVNQAKKNNVKKIIYMSSSKVYGNLNGKTNEKTIPAPTSIYGITKLCAEKIILGKTDKKTDAFVLRPTNFIGCPNKYKGTEWSLVPNELCKAALSKRRIVINQPKTERNFVSLYTISKCIQFLLKSNKIKKDIFNLGTNKNINIDELGEIIKKAVKKKYNIEIKVIKKKNRDNSHKFVFSSEKIKKKGFKHKDETKKNILLTLNFLKNEYKKV